MVSKKSDKAGEVDEDQIVKGFMVFKNWFFPEPKTLFPKQNFICNADI